MKKNIGWILVFCGVFSLPKFFMNLSSARGLPEVTGMFIGQSLIYYLAYLCLRNKTNNPDLSPQESNSVVESGQTNEDQNASSKIESSIEEDNNNESLIQDHNASMSINQNNVKISEPNHIVVDSIEPITSDIDKDPISDDESPKDFPQIDYASTSWEEIESYVFEYQKAELLEKCNPSVFMNPYNHDKVETANTISIKLNEATCLEDLKCLREMALSLGVKVSTSQIFEYLKTVCNPINFAGSKDLFSAANNLYGRILESKNNISELDSILHQAEGTISLKSDEEETPSPVAPKEPISKSKIAIFSIWGIWTCTHVFMWVYKGMSYNAKSYFFPFQTLNLKKYDYTEFIVYGIAIPAILFGIGKIVSYIRK